MSANAYNIYNDISFPRDSDIMLYMDLYNAQSLNLSAII